MAGEPAHQYFTTKQECAFLRVTVPQGCGVAMKARRLAFLALASACFGTVTAAVAETRAVVELFTSQGCSSCPAADKLLGELVNDPSLVALTLPIDYWDYLGWKDTLALP